MTIRESGNFRRESSFAPNSKNIRESNRCAAATFPRVHVNLSFFYTISQNSHDFGGRRGALRARLFAFSLTVNVWYCSSGNSLVKRNSMYSRAGSGQLDEKEGKRRGEIKTVFPSAADHPPPFALSSPTPQLPPVCLSVSLSFLTSAEYSSMAMSGCLQGQLVSSASYYEYF